MAWDVPGAGAGAGADTWCLMCRASVGLVTARRPKTKQNQNQNREPVPHGLPPRTHDIRAPTAGCMAAGATCAVFCVVLVGLLGGGAPSPSVWLELADIASPAVSSIWTTQIPCTSSTPSLVPVSQFSTP
jgi:hypothetical protein